VDELLSSMAESGITHAVISGFAFKDMGLCRHCNDYIMDSLRRYPGLFTGFGVVSPRSAQARVEIERCYAQGLRGIGELFPDGQGFLLNHREHMAEVAAACEEMGLPLLVHCNEQVGHWYPGKGATGPKEAYEFARENPNLTIILAHWGGGLFFYELMPEVSRQLARVYYDTAAGPFLYGPFIYKVAQAMGITGKVLLGTDYPLLKPQRYLAQITHSGLPYREKRRILEENARMILGITQVQSGKG